MDTCVKGPLEGLETASTFRSAVLDVSPDNDESGQNVPAMPVGVTMTLSPPPL